MTGNRRTTPRYRPDDYAELFFGGYGVELRIRDVSRSGIALERHGTAHVAEGDSCLVILTGYGEIEARVIRVEDDSYHLQFAKLPSDAARSFIEDHAARFLRRRNKGE